jgi:hypothetical protein
LATRARPPPRARRHNDKLILPCLNALYYCCEAWFRNLPVLHENYPNHPVLELPRVAHILEQPWYPQFAAKIMHAENIMEAYLNRNAIRDMHDTMQAMHHSMFQERRPTMDEVRERFCP